MAKKRLDRGISKKGLAVAWRTVVVILLILFIAGLVTAVILKMVKTITGGVS